MRGMVAFRFVLAFLAACGVMRAQSSGDADSIQIGLVTGTAKTFASKYKPIPGHTEHLVVVTDRDLTINFLKTSTSNRTRQSKPEFEARHFKRGDEISFDIGPGTEFDSPTITPGDLVSVEYSTTRAAIGGKLLARRVRLQKRSPQPDGLRRGAQE